MVNNILVFIINFVDKTFLLLLNSRYLYDILYMYLQIYYMIYYHNVEFNNIAFLLLVFHSYTFIIHVVYLIVNFETKFTNSLD